MLYRMMRCDWKRKSLNQTGHLRFFADLQGETTDLTEYISRGKDVLKKPVFREYLAAETQSCLG